MRQFRFRLELHPGGKINKGIAGDIGSAERVTREVIGLRQPLVHDGEKRRCPLPAALGQGGDLLIALRSGHRGILEEVGPVAQGLRGAHETLPLDPRQPFRHQRLFHRVTAQQRRLGADFLQIARDRGVVAQHNTIIERQRRHRAAWIDRTEGRLELGLGAEIDLDRFDFEAFFGDEHPGAPRAWRRLVVVEFHGKYRPLLEREP